MCIWESTATCAQKNSKWQTFLKRKQHNSCLAQRTELIRYQEGSRSSTQSLQSWCQELVTPTRPQRYCSRLANPNCIMMQMLVIWVFSKLKRKQESYAALDICLAHASMSHIMLKNCCLNIPHRCHDFQLGTSKPLWLLINELTLWLYIWLLPTVCETTVGKWGPRELASEHAQEFSFWLPAA